VTLAKTGKIAAIIGGIVLSLVIAVAVLVKILISPETVKRTVLPKISARIERQVTIGDVEVSIFRGIRLKSLEVREKDNSGPFLKAEAIRLSYRFWPLLSGRVEVDEVVLENPLVRVVRLPDGSFNFSDLKKKEPVREEESKEKSRLRLAVRAAGVSGGRVTYEDRGAVGGRGYTLEVTGVGLSANNISMEGEFPVKAEASLPGVTVSLSGTVAKAGSAPLLNGELAVAAKELSAAVRGLPPAVGEKLTKLALSGGVEARLKLGGEVKQPKGLLRGGEIRLSGLSLSAGGLRPTLTGALTLGSDSLESMGLTLALGEQKLGVNLTARNLFAKPVQIGLGLDGDRLDLDKLLPPKKEAGAPPPAAKAAAEPGPLQLPLEGGGAVRIGTLVCRGLALEGVNLAWRLKDNVVTVESLKGKGAGGSFSSTARLDMRTRGFAYGTSLDIQGVQADKLVSAFAPKAAGSITGTLALKTDLAGRGIGALKRNLVGRGTFTVADGKLSGEGFMPTLAAFLGAEELRVLRFTSLGGDFALRDGVVTLNGKGDGSDAKLLAAGRIKMDKTMDMGIELKLSPALTSRVARGSVGRFVADRDGWGSVPLRATGMVGKPSFSLDSAKVGSRAVESLRQRIGDRLLRQDTGTGGTQSPGRKGIEETLRGILGN